MRLLAIFLAVISLQLQGCAAVWDDLKRDPRDAAWDPKPGYTLMDQLPPWDRSDRCAGHLPPNQRKPHQTGRC